MTRRDWMHLAAASPLAAADISLPEAGKIPTRSSKAIAASPLSIGFETLDRKMFEPEKTYAALAEVGVKWARCQTGWARTETAKGTYDFGWLDQVVDSLLRIGIQPWFNLGYGNRLFTPGAQHESAVGWIPLYTPEAREAWVRYTRAIAEHFRTRVKHWEMWNEPNIKNFWQPTTPNPDDYVKFVQMTAPEIRKVIPGVTIVGGAFASIPGVLDYFDRAMSLGLGNLVDKISYHPYNAVPENNYASQVGALRGVLAKHGKPQMPLWQGENGCPSENGGSGALSNLDWNEERQAKWLLRRLLIDLTMGVELTSYFHTVDMVNYVWSSGKSGKTNFKGVLRGNTYERKPSYYALQNLAPLFDSETRRADFLIQVGNELGVERSAFVRRGSPIYTYWAPVSMQEPYPQKQVSLMLWGAEMRKPVLADLLTGTVHSVEAQRNGGFWNVKAAPLADYPLLITDAAVLGA